MADERPVYIWRINQQDQIVETNESWREFAKENESEELAERVQRTFLESHIHGEEVRLVYRQLLERVRGGRALSFPFRCDSPSLRRYLTMELVPMPEGHVEFRSTLERVEQRAPVPLLNPTVVEAKEMIRVCAWCQRVWASAWVEVEEAIVLLDLFSEPGLPPITHGICEECNERVFG